MFISICIGIVTGLYFVISINYFLINNLPMTLVFICYALANLGIYLGAK